MPRRNRSVRKGAPTRTDVDRLELYEELTPPWRLGSADPIAPAEWDRSVFGDRKHPYAVRGHREKVDRKPLA